jgi:hypothetical protein
MAIESQKETKHGETQLTNTERLTLIDLISTMTYFFYLL